MLFLEKTDVKKIGEICEGIANGSRIAGYRNVLNYFLASLLF